MRWLADSKAFENSVLAVAWLGSSSSYPRGLIDLALHFIPLMVVLSAVGGHQDLAWFQSIVGCRPCRWIVS